ncbi:NUMOD3 motif family protein [Dickeya phage phiDP23.1]|uniref:NUMOD3 motif family protein n=3 Tax=Aglimvirinae TaxID=2169530 RepID=A0A075E0W9_9CAUD|nr:NUMOD3 motif family protein [Dickeya phage RC-2014]AHZ60129.1 NUMOD3 motif family protein [Dickeya phage RC-2014]AIM51701.1 NUMOD3 motif family protein [Dickeya phage phiDP10.3]AIM51765.1 NUMOD3 motif family protein [Dickeya phage phiDP23.1]
MQPYVYRIKSKQGHFYYGCRYAQGCHPSDFWKTYFTSSTPVKLLIEEHGEDFFEPKVIRVCQTQEDALRIERTLISRSHKLPGCLNQFLCRKDGTPVHFGTFGPPSEETREKIRQALLGRKNSEEAKELMRQKKIGTRWNQSYRDGFARYQQTPKYTEVRNKIAMAHSKRTKTPGELSAISSALKGRKKPEGFGKRVSESNKARNQSLRVWQTNRAQPLKHVWAMADQFYQLWNNEGWGHERFCNRMNGGKNVRVFYNMFRMFKDEGWIPSQDPDWVCDFLS